MTFGPPLPAIVLAAGASTRMGRDKAALPWLGETTLLEWTVAALRATGWEPRVVLGPHNYPAWRGQLPDVDLVLNPDAARSKTTSLAAGARALASPPRLLVTSIDQPRPVALYAAMRLAADRCNQAVLVPDREGRRGHPVVLAGHLFPRLTALAESTRGLRGLLDEHADSTRRLACDPAWLRWDCNTPEAYLEARAWFEAQAVND